MPYLFENISHHEKLPFRIFFHSISNSPFHWHTDMEILFVLRGTVLAQIEGTEYVLHQDGVILIHSGEIHLTHHCNENNLILALQIAPSFAEKHDPEILNKRFDLNACIAEASTDPRFRRIREIMATMMWEVRIKRVGYQFKAESLLNELLSILIRDFFHVLRPKKIEEEQIKENTDYFPILKRIADFVDNKYYDKISLKQIAEKEDLSLGYLSRFFKKKVGCTFMEFVNLVRVSKSLPELENTHDNISDIAMNSGFSSIKAYNVFFKRTFNMTPSMWRNNHKKYFSKSQEVTGKGYVKLNPESALTLLREYIP